MSTSDDYDEVVRTQLASLDDTDAHASAWSDALAAAEASPDAKVAWGGRGRGGRGLSRRTFQPHDIIVDDVSLEYVNDTAITGTGGGGSKQLLDGASLKLLSGRTYSLVGRNGSGKSTLLKRMAAGKIPGFPPHHASLLISQELFGHDDMSAIDTVLENHRAMKKRSAAANEIRIVELEAQLDALDMESEDDQAKMEEICEEISELEEDSNDGDEAGKATDALSCWRIPEGLHSIPTAKLSGGVRKQVALACALFSRPNLLLLDEPTNFLDIRSLLCLRAMIRDFANSNAIIVLVSHDIDLINDVATDTIHLHSQKLFDYPGNYGAYVGYRKQGITHELRQADALERQRASMVKSIDNLKKKSAASSNRTGKKKIGRAIESRKKKLERHGVEKDEHGHRWTAQKACTMRVGAINSVDASTRNQLTHKQLLKRAEVDIGPVPDKEIQFSFRDPTTTWGDEPLVMAMDVGHGYDGKMIFDCVELCIRENSRTFILGENGSGKSSLLSILAGEMEPLEGSVHVASGLAIGYFHQHIADELIGNARDGSARNKVVTPLSLLSELYPKLPEQDLRGELTSFGLNPNQASTNVRFLSGGERCRLCLAAMMLENPDLLILDEISNHLDVESVEAIIYGMRKWGGTIICASHDTNLMRSIGGDCHVLLESEGKLRRIVGGVDAYLRSFR